MIGGARIAKSFAPGLGENARGGGIMRAVDDGALVPALETRRPFHGEESARNRGIVNIDLSFFSKLDGFKPSSWRAAIASAAFCF